MPDKITSTVAIRLNARSIRVCLIKSGFTWVRSGSLITLEIRPVGDQDVAWIFSSQRIGRFLLINGDALYHAASVLNPSEIPHVCRLGDFGLCSGQTER
jgi:hypothetical protein